MCGCSCTIHPSCLLALLDNGYRRCPSCCAEYSRAAVLEAARFAVDREATTQRRIFFGAALTAAKQPLRAIDVLLDDAICLEKQCEHTHWHVEIGFALLTVGLPLLAKMHLELAVATLRCGMAHRAPLFARALVGLAQSHLRLDDVRHASSAMGEALTLTKLLSGDEVVHIMRVVAKICRAKRDQQKCAEAHETICEIQDSEEPDPWARAKGRAEFAVAEIDLGRNASNRLRDALKVLRKRSTSDPVVEDAARALAVRPRKRLRCKCHPEDV